jgi:hypothetical protein
MGTNTKAVGRERPVPTSKRACDAAAYARIRPTTVTRPGERDDGSRKARAPAVTRKALAKKRPA